MKYEFLHFIWSNIHLSHWWRNECAGSRSERPRSRSIRAFHRKWPERSNAHLSHRWERFPEISVTKSKEKEATWCQIGTMYRMCNSAGISHLHTFIGQTKIADKRIIRAAYVTFQSSSTRFWADIRFQIWYMLFTEELCIIFYHFGQRNYASPSGDTSNEWNQARFGINFWSHFFGNLMSGCFSYSGLESSQMNHDSSTMKNMTKPFYWHSSRICNDSSDLVDLSSWWHASNMCGTHLQLKSLSSKLSWRIRRQISLEMLKCRHNALQEMNGRSLSILLIISARSIRTKLPILSHTRSIQPSKKPICQPFTASITGVRASYACSSSFWKCFALRYLRVRNQITARCSI
jgi:hypothetical protein